MNLAQEVSELLADHIGSTSSRPVQLAARELRKIKDKAALDCIKVLKSLDKDTAKVLADEVGKEFVVLLDGLILSQIK